jgi:hypothetical protein
MLELQILKDDMYCDLIQDYDTEYMSDKEMSETHNYITQIINNYYEMDINL